MSGLYVKIWEKYLDAILCILKKQQGAISLDCSLFEKAGNRPKAGYSFRLDIKDGVVPIKSGTAVARDLKKVLDESVEFQKVAKGENIIIRLDKKFNLIVEQSKF
ncbi:MAG: hypothetical protein NC396_02480 [Bacteroides sp.]|nr:hypothetical protein [Bacteroides sp.]MCM1085057.1 hypothetical protein [Bacteroides sp.]